MYLRIDIVLSTLSKSDNIIEVVEEEINIKNEISKMLNEMEYKKYIIGGHEFISNEIKEKIEKEGNFNTSK